MKMNGICVVVEMKDGGNMKFFVSDEERKNRTVSRNFPEIYYEKDFVVVHLSLDKEIAICQTDISSVWKGPGIRPEEKSLKKL